MGNKTPNYNEINELEGKILHERWKVIRYAIDHNGEKGSAAEFEAIQLLKSFLPNEYGLTTGFIIFHDNIDFWNNGTQPVPKLSKR